MARGGREFLERLGTLPEEVPVLERAWHGRCKFSKYAFERL